jgi:hypothetical protein
MQRAVHFCALACHTRTAVLNGYCVHGDVKLDWLAGFRWAASWRGVEQILTSRVTGEADNRGARTFRAEASKKTAVLQLQCSQHTRAWECTPGRGTDFSEGRSCNKDGNLIHGLPIYTDSGQAQFHTLFHCNLHKLLVASRSLLKLP